MRRLHVVITIQHPLCILVSMRGKAIWPRDIYDAAIPFLFVMNHLHFSLLVVLLMSLSLSLRPCHVLRNKSTSPMDHTVNDMTPSPPSSDLAMTSESLSPSTIAMTSLSSSKSTLDMPLSSQSSTVDPACPSENLH